MLDGGMDPVSEGQPKKVGWQRRTSCQAANCRGAFPPRSLPERPAADFSKGNDSVSGTFMTAAQMADQSNGLAFTAQVALKTDKISLFLPSFVPSPPRCLKR